MRKIFLILAICSAFGIGYNYTIKTPAGDVRPVAAAGCAYHAKSGAKGAAHTFVTSKDKSARRAQNGAKSAYHTTKASRACKNAAARRQAAK